MSSDESNKDGTCSEDDPYYKSAIIPFDIKNK